MGKAGGLKIFQTGGVIFGIKQLKYYFKFMKMTDIDLFYIKKTINFYIKHRYLTEPSKKYSLKILFVDSKASTKIIHLKVH